MLCPKCNSKLYCQNSRQFDNDNRIREYACLKCNVVYQSEENLDPTIIRRKIQKRLMKGKK